ncbi:MAG: 4-alpha-glucanotransferase [Desulfocapsaceae bacterium]|nr:4-alpha-glucanotransferase [Desulfocapsaceae bacterium]
MNPIANIQRTSGILAHLTSLPSPYGIGDMGPSGYSFLQFLHDCGQSCWQFLPVGPTNPIFDNSPYMSTSAFAGSPLLISPDLLYQNGLISQQTRDDHPDFSPFTTEFAKVIPYKKKVLHEAYRNFSPGREKDYASFLARTPWLEDYALYMTLKEKFSQSCWNRWPDQLAAHVPSALASIKDQEPEIFNYYRYEQYEYFRQWEMLHQKARNLNIRLFGDIPIYVGYDSVDAWANQEIFELDPASRLPARVAGVPPDYFSETGQRWGNPIYLWNTKNRAVQKRLLTWWTQRFSSVFFMCDMARIDHFRGFESYWSIPADEKTAVNGRWVKGPGKPFFANIFSALGKLDIVAEDLGEISPAVIKLKESLGLPGMKILQFAFDNKSDNAFLPCNFTSPNCVVYTGTHDNDTTVGWYLSDKLSTAAREQIKNFANRDSSDVRGIHQDIIYLALSSTARLAIIPLQDILGFGGDCRMNTPGTKEGNWAWRCAPQFFTAEIAAWLRQKTALFGRLPKIGPEKS